MTPHRTLTHTTYSQVAFHQDRECFSKALCTFGRWVKELNYLVANLVSLYAPVFLWRRLLYPNTAFFWQNENRAIVEGSVVAMPTLYEHFLGDWAGCVVAFDPCRPCFNIKGRLSGKMFQNFLSVLLWCVHVCDDFSNSPMAMWSLI
jgi:hypothetical protein